jgi:uroporphyrinogen III methyltransferase/synthase
VGTGPGDPGLITVAGLERLRAAEVVVYDRLVHPALLSEAPHALLIYVGEQADYLPLPQDELNQLLVEHARSGRTVVRLECGDPFAFGRGGEEAEALSRAGIAFEVVPGVSSAVAVPAYAGIPVTHPALACSVAVITVHPKADRADEIACDWQRAIGADTLVFLTGISALPSIVENLIQAGRTPQTPAAVIERGTFGRQRTVTGTIESISGIVAAAEIVPPITLVVGDVVSLREKLRWFDLDSRRPLLGLRVLNTRAADDGEELGRALRELGAEPLSLPATQTGPPQDPAPLDAAIEAIALGSAAAPAFDWIGFTSANAVSAFMDRLLHTHAPRANQTPCATGLPGSRALDARVLGRTRLAAVGPATAEALARYGLVADLVPDRAAGRQLAAALGDVARQRILLPRSDVAMRDFPDELRARGAAVTEVVTYTTQPAPANQVILQAILRHELDAATFFSPSAVHGLATQVAPAELADVLRGIPAVCVGATTAQAARDKGLTEVLTAEETSVAGIMRALVKWRAQY